MKSILLIVLLVTSATAATNEQAQIKGAASVQDNKATPTQAAPALPINSQGQAGITSDGADYAKYSAIIVSLLALGYTIWKDRKMEKRMKKVEQEQEREKSEAAIRRSRASAPFFSPSKELFAHIYERNDEGEIEIWESSSGNVLSMNHNEFPNDAEEKTPVIMVLDSGGKGARQIHISGDIQGAQIKQEPQFDGAHGLVFLKYPYTPSQHGKKQKVIFTFETEDGLTLIHTYETRHGCFEFRRIDPK
jgi:hypothetical protein